MSVSAKRDLFETVISPNKRPKTAANELSNNGTLDESDLEVDDDDFDGKSFYSVAMHKKREIKLATVLSEIQTYNSQFKPKPKIIHDEEDDESNDSRIANDTVLAHTISNMSHTANGELHNLSTACSVERALRKEVGSPKRSLKVVNLPLRESIDDSNKTENRSSARDSLRSPSVNGRTFVGNSIVSNKDEEDAWSRPAFEAQLDNSEYGRLISRKIALPGNPDDEKIVMAISYRGRKLGAAFFNIEQSVMFLVEDMEENDQFELVKMLIFQVEPNVVISHTRIDESLISILKSHEIDGQLEVQIRPNTEFEYHAARGRLLSSKIGDSMVSNSTFKESEIEMLFYLESFVSMEQSEMICCAGALISHIRRLKVTGTIDDQNEIDMDMIKAYSLNNVMKINADALCSLQIFDNERHPNMHNNSTKEGLSLWGILNATVTPLGKTLMRQWFLRPSLCIEDINVRHDTVDLLFRSSNETSAAQLKTALRSIKNIPKILAKMRKGAQVTDWQHLLKFCYAALKIRQLIMEINYSRSPIFQALLDSINVKDLQKVGTTINAVVDFDKSEKYSRTSVKEDVDDNLDALKKKYYGLNEFLSQVARQVIHGINSNFASSINVIYFPQLGYLITIPHDPLLLAEGIEGLSFQFSTSSTIYYKNEQMFGMRIVKNLTPRVELDETLGDLHSIIADREIEIVQRLQETILQCSDRLKAICHSLSELDCILSFAQVSAKYGYVRPTMTEESLLDVTGGRHPLQELCVDNFIANDIKLGCETNTARGILLTGPNFSGKSIYLKTGALITFMAHIGCFVPARSAIIGITDMIFTRLQTRESVSKLQSAFMIDLHQVSIALRNSTSQSLVLIDEFGKGTLSTDGIGLFCAVIESFASRLEDCPRLIAATHFHEIFEYSIIKSAILAEKTMEIIENKDKAEGVVFLYRVSDGHATSSWGFNCAEIAGVEPKVIRRAREVSVLLKEGKELRPVESVTGRMNDRVATLSKMFEEIEMDEEGMATLFSTLE